MTTLSEQIAASTSLPAKKVLVETWGCQMNVADSESLLAQLKQMHYEVTSSPDEADLVLLNTCHIREKAKHKVLSRLGVLKEIRKKNKKMKIAVAGCVAQAEGKKLLKAAPQIDILFGPGKIPEFQNLLNEHLESGKQTISVGFKNDRSHVEGRNAEVKPVAAGMNPVSRFVNITQGCDNFCTFCVVPFTRGREISRLPQDIVEEAKSLLASGAKEITLLGQNVNSYGSDLVASNTIIASPDGAFVDLLTAVVQIPGLERLRFTTSNPHDFTKPLANLFAKHPAMGRYIHLPVQSGDDKVLERMRRKVTVEEYMQRVAWLKAVDPDFAISTDLIVGFPGETDEQFENTMKLVAEIRYSFIFAFKYSPRKNTAAARFADQVPESVKTERLARLNALQDQITIEHHTKEIGRKREVLYTYKSNKEENIYYGRTKEYRLVRTASQDNLIGRICQAEVIDANKTALVANIF